MTKSEMNFKNPESLDSVRKVINEANEALDDASRTISTSALWNLGSNCKQLGKILTTNEGDE